MGNVIEVKNCIFNHLQNGLPITIQSSDALDIQWNSVITNNFLGKIGHFSAQMNPVITNKNGRSRARYTRVWLYVYIVLRIVVCRLDNAHIEENWGCKISAFWASSKWRQSLIISFLSSLAAEVGSSLFWSEFLSCFTNKWFTVYNTLACICN